MFICFLSYIGGVLGKFQSAQLLLGDWKELFGVFLFVCSSFLRYWCEVVPRALCVWTSSISPALTPQWFFDWNFCSFSQTCWFKVTSRQQRSNRRRAGEDPGQDHDPVPFHSWWDVAGGTCWPVLRSSLFSPRSSTEELSGSVAQHVSRLSQVVVFFCLHR